MRIFLGILVALAVLFGIAAYFLVDMVQAQALAFLQQKNIPFTSLTVSGITPTSVSLRDVKLGEKNALIASSITLAYRGGTSLETLRLNISADGLEVRAKQTTTGWRMGGIERLWDDGREAGTLVASYHIKGGMSLTGSAAKDIAGQLTLDEASTTRDGLTIRGQDVTIRPDMDAAGGDVEYKVKQLVVLQGKTPMLAPLKLEGEARRRGHTLAHHTEISAAPLAFEATMDGEHQLDTQNGTAKILLPETTFEPSGLTFETLAPGYAAGVATPPLKLAASNTVKYTADGGMNATGVVDVLAMPVGNLIAQALGKGASMDGVMKGQVPFNFVSTDNWRLKDAHLENDGPMKLTLLPVPGELGGLVNTLTAVLSKQNAPAGALNEVNVSHFSLAANSIDGQGNMLLKGEVEGFNPLLKRPVKLHLNLTTNLRDMLRSMAAVAAEKILK